MGRLAFIGIVMTIVCVGASASPPPPAPASAPAAQSVREADRFARSLESRVERYHWREDVWKQARRVRPERRDWPARWENITDEEVREIQVASRAYIPKALVNIGTVVTGCPCEDGAGCSNQVWVVATNDKGSYGLQLSRIEARWKVGPVQRWWHLMARLDPEAFPTYSAYEQARDRLLSEFPTCAVASPAVTATAVP